MRRKKILYAALAIASLTSMTALKTYAASTTMPSGTVVIGTRAFDLNYANDPKNLNEITAAIIAGGQVYFKGFDGVWINNTTSNTTSSSVIPSVTYKSSTGTEIKYVVGDKLQEAADSLEVISIE